MKLTCSAKYTWRAIDQAGPQMVNYLNDGFVQSKCRLQALHHAQCLTALP